MSFEIKRGTDRPAISTTLTDSSGLSVNITGYNDVEMKMLSDVGETILEDNTSGRVNVLDASTGDVEYVWQSQDLSDVGTYKVEWKVTYSDGGTEKFPSKGYNIVEVTEGTE